MDNIVKRQADLDKEILVITISVFEKANKSLEEILLDKKIRLRFEDNIGLDVAEKELDYVIPENKMR